MIKGKLGVTILFLVCSSSSIPPPARVCIVVLYNVYTQLQNFLTSLWKSMALSLISRLNPGTWTISSRRQRKLWESHLLPEKAQKATSGYPQQLHCSSLCSCNSIIPHHIAFSYCGTPIGYSSCLLPSVLFCLNIVVFWGRAVWLTFSLEPILRHAQQQNIALLRSMQLVKVILIISAWAKNVCIQLHWFIYQELDMSWFSKLDNEVC
jgi:hypothetical protein